MRCHGRPGRLSSPSQRCWLRGVVGACCHRATWARLVCSPLSHPEISPPPCHVLPLPPAWGQEDDVPPAVVHSQMADELVGRL